MITKCSEIAATDDDPNRSFLILHDGSICADDIFRLCGNIPKIYQKRGGKWPEWTCTKIEYHPCDRDHSVVKCIFSPPSSEIAIYDRLPIKRWEGLKGDQPDGTMVIPPEAAKALSNAMMWGFPDKQNGLRQHTSICAWSDFMRIYHEETGFDMCEFT